MPSATQYNTIQTHLVRNALFSLANHPTASQVYDYIHEDHPSISKATVYRALNKLVDLGEARKICINNGADRFDHQTSRHYHVQCSICGKVDDVLINPLDSLMQNAEDVSGYLIQKYEIQFDGICPACNNAQIAENPSIYQMDQEAGKETA